MAVTADTLQRTLLGVLMRTDGSSCVISREMLELTLFCLRDHQERLLDIRQLSDMTLAPPGEEARVIPKIHEMTYQKKAG